VDSGHVQTRRATLDDLPALKGLWDVNRLPTNELERHLTECQLAQRSDGVLLSSIAFRTLGTQGLLHSEAAFTERNAGEARPALWDRIRILARNQGLARLWLRGQPNAFWCEAGFCPASVEDLRGLPPAFGLGPDAWWVCTLWDEEQVQRQLADRIESFHEAEQAYNDRLRRQALWLKWTAALIATGFLIGAGVLLLRILLRSARRRR
jgi:N-acetylglutamate synthase-like GNAT family acetyltransferase